MGPLLFPIGLTLIGFVMLAFFFMPGITIAAAGGVWLIIALMIQNKKAKENQPVT